MREVRQQTIPIPRKRADNDNLVVPSTRSQACVLKLRSSVAYRYSRRSSCDACHVGASFLGHRSNGGGCAEVQSGTQRKIWIALRKGSHLLCLRRECNARHLKHSLVSSVIQCQPSSSSRRSRNPSNRPIQTKKSSSDARTMTALSDTAHPLSAIARSLS